MAINTQPNILFVVADDMGYGDFGRFNHGLTQTPNLDRLTGESVCLSQHYSASALCAPARASLLTGRYPHRTGVIDTMAVGGFDRMSLRETTIAEVLHANGYSTAIIGKWHCGFGGGYHPLRRGFDQTVVKSSGHYFDWTLTYNHAKSRRSDGTYLTDVLTDEAISFLRRERSSPFFLHLAYHNPHGPWQAPAEDLAEYVDKGPWNKGVAHVYAMIRRLDWNIGRLLAALDESGLSENTLVVFTSDNGPQFDCGDREWRLDRFNCGFKGAKGSVHEGGIRVPLVARWPAGFQGGRYYYEMVHFVDWFPTLLAAAGVRLPTDLLLDGDDMMPVLRGEGSRVNPVRFWQWSRLRPLPTLNAAMRDGEWKLVYPGARFANIFYREDVKRSAQIEADPDSYLDHVTEPYGRHAGEIAVSYVTNSEPELYNLRSDPLEHDDLALRFPRRVDSMKQALADWFAEVDHELCSIDEPAKKTIWPLSR